MKLRYHFKNSFLAVQLIGLLYGAYTHGQEIFRLGVENVSLDGLQRELGLRNRAPVVGLIANQTSRSKDGMRTLDVLRAKNITVQVIFAPEHGFTGTVLAGLTVHDERDRHTGVPIMSLYKEGSGKKVDPAALTDLDCLMYDLQDCGMRHYTYISTLLRAMEGAAAADKPLVILDRPNPLGGLVEGPLVDEGLISFISIASIPLRHGMTVGELAHYFNRYVLKKPVKLVVVPLSGYVKDTHQFELLAQLSPNIQSLQSIHGYSFLGLLGEIAPFDVGIGTDRAFQMFALPKRHAIEWHVVQKILLDAGIESQLYSYMRESKKEDYQGLTLHIPSIQTVQAFPLLLQLLSFFAQQGVTLSFSGFFDKALGTASVRQSLLNSKSCPNGISDAQKALIDFHRHSQPCRLY